MYLPDECRPTSNTDRKYQARNWHLMYLHLQKPAPTWIVIYTPEIHSSCNNNFVTQCCMKYGKGRFQYFGGGMVFRGLSVAGTSHRRPKNEPERTRSVTPPYTPPPTMGKKAKTSSGKKKALERKIDRTTLPPPPPNPEDEVRSLIIFRRLNSSVQDGCQPM